MRQMFKKICTICFLKISSKKIDMGRDGSEFSIKYQPIYIYIYIYIYMKILAAW